VNNEKLHVVYHSPSIVLAEDNLVTTKRWLRLDNKWPVSSWALPINAITVLGWLVSLSLRWEQVAVLLLLLTRHSRPASFTRHSFLCTTTSSCAFIQLPLHHMLPSHRQVLSVINNRGIYWTRLIHYFRLSVVNTQEHVSFDTNYPYTSPA